MNCPICKGKEKQQLYRLCDNMKVMGDNFPETPAFISKCESCGLLYMDTEATQADFLSYYKHGAVAPKYYDMFGKDATDDYYEHLEELIKPYINDNSRILDIAGAWGELAGFLSERGITDITVLDPNEQCIENVKKIGVKAVASDSTNMKRDVNDRYDMIILNHTLEHILDVESTMKNISGVLREDGYLFIEIPDVEGYAGEDTAPFNFLTYEHVLHMMMHDLENLSAKYGYTIIEQGHYYKKVSNYPCIYAVLKKGSFQEITYSDESKQAMLLYIKKSEKSLEQFLEPLRESGEKLILWGIGASTAILIEAFRGCNVAQLIDKNPARQGLVFHIGDRQYRVQPPDEVGEGTIVILSIPYHDSIEKQIRKMGLKNKIVALKQE